MVVSKIHTQAGGFLKINYEKRNGISIAEASTYQSARQDKNDDRIGSRLVKIHIPEKESLAWDRYLEDPLVRRVIDYKVAKSIEEEMQHERVYKYLSENSGEEIAIPIEELGIRFQETHNVDITSYGPFESDQQQSNDDSNDDGLEEENQANIVERLKELVLR